jgi:hypothetical protein
MLSTLETGAERGFLEVMDELNQLLCSFLDGAPQLDRSRCQAEIVVNEKGAEPPIDNAAQGQEFVRTQPHTVRFLNGHVSDEV